MNSRPMWCYIRVRTYRGEQKGYLANISERPWILGMCKGEREHVQEDEENPIILWWELEV
jgi:hypothetical protein